jgi:hypothetical protein
MNQVFKKKSKLCYFCGKPDANSKDHIPPRSIFPKKPQGQLITVPAHKNCNESFHQDDELFRNIIISGCYNNDEGKKAWNEQVVNSWNNNPGAKSVLKELLIPVLIKDSISGSDTQKYAIKLDLKLFERQVKRWARGLYYNRFNRPLNQNSKIIVERLLPPNISLPVINNYFIQNGSNPKWIHIEPNVFSYFFASSYENRDIGYIIFVFFNTEVYTAYINLSGI